MAETLSMISKISFVAAEICLVVAIILFIRFKIPDVIGDLSGRNARKSIEQMRHSMKRVEANHTNQVKRILSVGN